MHPGSAFAHRSQSVRQPDPAAAFLFDRPALEESAAQPDAEFFIHCWTVGPARAAEDLLERLRLQKEHACPAAPLAAPLTVPIPSISTAEFLRNRQMYASEASSWQGAAQPFLPARETESSAIDNSTSDAICDFVVENPCTPEQARRLLGVDAGSTPAQIKSAYKQLVRIHHPDRHESGSWQDRRTASARMAAINRAYSLLESSGPKQPASNETAYR